MAQASMRSNYKIIRALRKAENGLSDNQLRLKFPALDTRAAVASLEALGYISHRIAGYKVKAQRETKISHDYNERWYPTDLGLSALEQFQGGQPRKASNWKLVLLLIAVCAACAAIFYLVSRPVV